VVLAEGENWLSVGADDFYFFVAPHQLAQDEPASGQKIEF